jgi:hypothetical protein
MRALSSIEQTSMRSVPMKPRIFEFPTMVAAILLLLCLLTVSCTHKMVHPLKGDQEWTLDHDACEAWAREGIRDDPDTYDAFDEMKLINSCMRQKGWEWERTDLFDFGKSSTE